MQDDKKKANKPFANLIIALALLLTVFFCTFPNFQPEHFFNQPYSRPLDIAFHSLYFFFITLFIRFFLPAKIKLKYLVLAVPISAFLLESVQIWIPGRTFTLMDMASNVCGITAALIAFHYYRRMADKKNQSLCQVQKQ